MEMTLDIALTALMILLLLRLQYERREHKKRDERLEDLELSLRMAAREMEDSIECDKLAGHAETSLDVLQAKRGAFIHRNNALYQLKAVLEPESMPPLLGPLEKKRIFKDAERSKAEALKKVEEAMEKAKLKIAEEEAPE